MENSEILPIGKPTVDATPVPIHLSSKDVDAEIARLNLSAPNKSINSVSSQVSAITTTTTTTTTIITNQSGAILTTQTEDSPNTPLTSPKPKSSDDSPGSP